MDICQILPNFTGFVSALAGIYRYVVTRPCVVVRAFRGRPLIRWVWAVDRRTVYVVDDENLARLESGVFDVPPVGFPIEDVFEPSSERETTVSKWETLKHWDPRSFFIVAGVTEFTKKGVQAHRVGSAPGSEVA